MNKVNTRLMMAGVFPGVLLILIALLADVVTGARDGFGTMQSLILVVGVVATVIGGLLVINRPDAARKLILSIVALTMTYAMAEAVCSGYFFVKSLFADRTTQSFWIFEDSGKTIQFDPVRGYWLTPTPSRFARITKGEVEYVGAYRGNAQGYPDRDDFTMQKPDHVARRYVVFGDSFSAPPFFDVNWPDRVEEISEGRTELMNLSIDGGGLGNWWSSLARFLDEEDYEFDGVIFAVYDDDLERRFSVAEHRDHDRHMFGRVPTWNPDEFPKTREEAELYMWRTDGYVVDHKEFEALLEYRRMTLPKADRGTLDYFWLTHKIYERWKSFRSAMFATTQEELDDLDKERWARIHDMKRRLDERGVSSYVVYIPNKLEVKDPSMESERMPEAKEFARFMDAQFINGREAFANLDSETIRTEWFPYDGHWAQGGSDRFARFMATTLSGFVD